MYNPILPIYLYDRGLWILIDVVFLILLLIPLFRGDVERVNEEEPLHDRLFRMSESQRRKDLDEALQFDSIMMNQNRDYWINAHLREMEIEQILQEAELEKVNRVRLEQAIDEIIIHTGDINFKICMNYDFYFLLRNTIFLEPNHLGGNQGWRLYNPKTNETIAVGFYLENLNELSNSISYEILIFAVPEFLKKQIKHVEGKLLQKIEQDAKQNGVEEISVHINKTEYFSYLYKNGYRTFFYWKVDEMIEKVESGAKSYITLVKPITQEARDRKAKELVTRRSVKKYLGSVK